MYRPCAVGPAPTSARDVQVFAAPLADGARAVLLFNRAEKGAASAVRLPLARLGYPVNTTAAVRDLFDEVDLTDAHDVLRVTVAVDSVVMLRLLPLACVSLREQSAVVRQIEAHHATPHEAASMAGVLKSKNGETRPEQPTLKRARSSSGPDCDIGALDAWRPWDHGFFGLPPTLLDEEGS